MTPRVQCVQKACIFNVCYFSLLLICQIIFLKIYFMFLVLLSFPGRTDSLIMPSISMQSLFVLLFLSTFIQVPSPSQKVANEWHYSLQLTDIIESLFSRFSLPVISNKPHNSPMINMVAKFSKGKQKLTSSCLLLRLCLCPQEPSAAFCLNFPTCEQHAPCATLRVS